MGSNKKNSFDFNGLFTFEMANNHQGSVTHGKKIIVEMGKIARKHKLRAAVKLQFRDLDTFIHPDFKKDKNNKHIPRFLSTRLDEDQFGELIKEVKKQGMYAMSTPFDEKSVELLERLGVDILKIGSCSAKDWPLLERAVLAGKPVIASTGGFEMRDIDNLVSFFDHRYTQFAIMHCVSIYPTPKEELQINQIAKLCERYPGVTIGFSTHESPDNFDAIRVAYAKGARIFERHVGVETKTIKLNAYSSTPKQIEEWVSAYEDAVAMCGPETRPPIEEKEKEDLFLLMRGVFANKDIKKGEDVKRKDVFFAIPIQSGQLTSGQFKEGMIADKSYKKNSTLADSLSEQKPQKKEIIYQTIHQIKGMLNEMKIPVGDEFSVELSHHDGIDNFHRTGVTIIDCINREYCKKILIQLPGQSHPYHHHTKKEEAFHVLSGELQIELNGKPKTLFPGDVQVIQRGVKHRFWTGTGAIFEEISTTHHNDDSLYQDQRINRMAREDRKTVLVNWGRHQFD